MPGTWYGVQTANDIFKELSDQSNFGMKICSFRDGEIITKDILKEAMGEGYHMFEKANANLMG